MPEPGQMNDAQVERLIPPGARAGLIRAGLLPASPTAGDLRQALARLTTDFRDKAPLSAAGAWRILVGQDARRIDAAVRARPEAAYDYAELFSAARHPPARARTHETRGSRGILVRNGGMRCQQRSG
jgi:hypothetical protein